MRFSTEKLIACVENYPVLYDKAHPDFKNFRKKDEIWFKLVEILGENEMQLKKKWKNLRDSYVKHLRMDQNGYIAWPWAKHMKPFRPFLSGGGHSGRLEDSSKHFTQFEGEFSEPDEDEEVAQDALYEHDDPLEEEVQKAKRMKLSEPPTPLENVEISFEIGKIEETPPSRPPLEDEEEEDGNRAEKDNAKALSCDTVCASAAHCHQLSATEHIFLGFAKVVEKFTARRQAAIKKKIANLVFETEILEAVEVENSLH